MINEETLGRFRVAATVAQIAGGSKQVEIIK